MEPVFSEAAHNPTRTMDSEVVFPLQLQPVFVKFPHSNSTQFVLKIVEKDSMPTQETETANLALQTVKAA